MHEGGSAIGPSHAYQDARPNESSLRTQLWRARTLALSVGLVFWGMGTAIVWWLEVGPPTVAGGSAAVWTATSAAMLAAFVAGVGSRWSWRTSGTVRVADPVAETWWVLNAYPIFPAMGVLFALRDAGVLTGEQQPLATLVVWAALLFARGTVLLSPAGPRALRAIEAHGTAPAEPAGWLVFGAGGAYLLAAGATFGAAATGRFWLGVVVSLGALTAIHVAAAALARRPEARAPAPQ